MTTDTLDPVTDIRVTLVVYDLLPEGRVSSLAYFLGVGIYHTSIRITSFSLEFAFGGHTYPGVTGIFATRVIESGDEATPPHPGIRWIANVDMGSVKVPSRPKANRTDSAASGRSDTTLSGDERKGLIGRRRRASDASTSGSTITLAEFPPSTTRTSSVNKTPSVPNQYGLPRSSSPVGTTNGTSIISLETEEDQDQDQTVSIDEQRDFVESTFRELRESTDWMGPSYSLLQRNCNSFTNEVCRRLTGKAAPGWTNRAAMVGNAIPCLVPTEWIEPPVAEVESTTIAAPAYNGSQPMNSQQRPTAAHTF